MSFPTKEGKYLTVWFKIQFISIVNWVLYYKQSVKEKNKDTKYITTDKVLFPHSYSRWLWHPYLELRRYVATFKLLWSTATPLDKGTQDQLRRQAPQGGRTESCEEFLNCAGPKANALAFSKSFCHLVMLNAFSPRFFPSSTLLI